MEDLVDYLCLVAIKQDVFFLWRPLLRDPDDDMIVEVAVAASCTGVVTHNIRDFGAARTLGLEIWTPGEFLSRPPRRQLVGTLSLRLPESLHRKLAEVAEQEGISLNQLISSAAAEKLAALMTEDYLMRRAARASARKFLEDLPRGVSKLRNRVIGRVFHALGLIEQWGSGIQRMTTACREAGLAAPAFEELASRFRVTIATDRVDHPRLDDTDQDILHSLLGSEGRSTHEIAQAIGLTPRRLGIARRETRSRTVSRPPGRFRTRKQAHELVFVGQVRSRGDRRRAIHSGEGW